MVLLVEGDEAQSMALEDDVRIEHRAVPIPHLFEPVGCRTTWANVGVAAMGNLSCREPWVPLVWLMAQLHRVVTAMTTVCAHKHGWQIWSPDQSTTCVFGSVEGSAGGALDFQTCRDTPARAAPGHHIDHIAGPGVGRRAGWIRGVAVRCRGGRGCPGLRPPGPGAQRPASLNPGMIFAASWIQSFATGGAQRNPGDSGRMWLLSSARWTSSRETIHTTTRFSSRCRGRCRSEDRDKERRAMGTRRS